MNAGAQGLLKLLEQAEAEAAGAATAEERMAWEVIAAEFAAALTGANMPAPVATQPEEA